MSETKDPNIKEIKVVFSGGLEILFFNKREMKVKLPAKDKDGKSTTIGYLIHYLVDNHMGDPRKDLFVLDGTVRPGIFVLINNADWELEGKDECEIEEGNEVLFVSTLHGG